MLDGGFHHASINIIQDIVPPTQEVFMPSKENILEIELHAQTLEKISEDLDQTQSQSEQVSSKLHSPIPTSALLVHKSDKLNLLMLLGLYTIWGLVFGYFANSLNVILIKRGATYSSLSLLTIMAYPFTLKFLFAPLVDSYYFKFLGKHKTYILFSNYLMSFFLLLNAFYIEEWIRNLEITKITALGFLVVFAFSFQSIAVDAWPPSLLRPENMRYVGFISNFGQILGMIFSYNLFIWFNSRSFCNSYIYSTYHEEPLISSFWLLVALSITTFIITALVHVFKKEEATPKKEFETCGEFLRTLSRFGTNPNIRFLIFATFFMGVGMQPIELGYVLILKKGFSQNMLSLLDLIGNIMAPFAGIYGSYLAKKKKEFSYLLICFAFNIIGDIMYYFFVINYDSVTPKVSVVLYLLQEISLSVNQSIRLVLFVSFLLRVADPKMTAVYTTFFYSVYNLNGLLTVSFSLLLIDYMNYTILCSLGISFAVIFLIVFGRRIIKMENVEKNLWLITD